MGFQYTEDQQKVISLRNRNILVSAAAGSGKTAVLTERIVDRLKSKEEKGFVLTSQAITALFYLYE